MNKKNNKGFSLVELIVVVAIMAVLVGVLAPAYLKYVEKSRVQKDISAVGEVVNAIKVAAADEDVNTYLASGGTSGAAVTATYTIGKGTSAEDFAKTDVLTKELKATIGKAEVTSNSVTSVTVTATVTSGELKITVTPTLTVTDADITADFTALGNVTQ